MYPLCRRQRWPGERAAASKNFRLLALRLAAGIGRPSKKCSRRSSFLCSQLADFWNLGASPALARKPYCWLVDIAINDPNVNAASYVGDPICRQRLSFLTKLPLPVREASAPSKLSKLQNEQCFLPGCAGPPLPSWAKMHGLAAPPSGSSKPAQYNGMATHTEIEDGLPGFLCSAAVIHPSCLHKVAVLANSCYPRIAKASSMHDENYFHTVMKRSSHRPRSATWTYFRFRPPFGVQYRRAGLRASFRLRINTWRPT